MIELMKKRKKQKLQKLFKRAIAWIGWLYTPLLILCISIYSFTSLHNGASIRDVVSNRYAPVLSELLLITVVVTFLLIGLRVIAKLKNGYIIALGIALFGLIGIFGYWAFNFTRQDPWVGFWTILIMIGSISLITAAALLYESHIRSKRTDSKK